MSNQITIQIILITCLINDVKRNKTKLEQNHYKVLG